MISVYTLVIKNKKKKKEKCFAFLLFAQMVQTVPKLHIFLAEPEVI